MITDVNKVIVKNFWNDFVSRYKLDIITAFFLLILVAATASVYPYLIQLVFDGLLDNKNNDWIILPMVIAFVAVIRGIAMFFQIKQVSKISLSISVDIQKKLSRHLINTDLVELNKLSSGNHVSRIMNDVNLIRDGFERSINNLIRDQGLNDNDTINDYVIAQVKPEIENLGLTEDRNEMILQRVMEMPGKPTSTQITKGLPAEIKSDISEYIKNFKI